jgi:GH15 family glucan-1,4-alpha-glucosidase
VTNHPIADYALLSDCHSAALVGRDGSVDWLCFPRFDSPSIFGRLLGRDAGHWVIRPVGEFTVTRRYLDRSMILETTFRAPQGTLILTDGMALGSGERGHRLGVDAPHALLRRAACGQGEVEVVLEFVPRPEYGLVVPLLRPAKGGVLTRGSANRQALSSTVALEITDGAAQARFELRAGEEALFGLQWARSWDDPPLLWDPAEVGRRLEEAGDAWRSWSELHQSYDGPWHELVLHSGRVLQALTFQPTGAFVAAPTTSLPETVGGERNWDYRYAWVRDASLTLHALWVAACPDEAEAFFDWMVGSASADLRAGAHLPIMFGVGGEHDLTERHLPHLEGWRGSRPVRVGNDAWSQAQLDAYGELLDAAWRLVDQLGEPDELTRRFFVDLAEAAADRWKERDQGIWEVRSGPQHFLYSKLMCWVALDRAVRLGDRLRAGDRVVHWERAREDIRQAILEQGFDREVGAFTQAFGSQALDASALMLPITGFLPADDPRIEATIRAIEERLTDDGGLVYRYRGAEDGLEGGEGTFLLCTFWLAHCHALAGRVGRARELFELAVSFRNDVDLLSEEVDPATGELLGNFPQAFSHIGLITAAWAIAEAEGRTSA